MPNMKNKTRFEQNMYLKDKGYQFEKLKSNYVKQIPRYITFNTSLKVYHMKVYEKFFFINETPLIM